ncbi:hypothetical protein [Candidatus Williamhamiltonella defendens]|uniref:hypothetical protein n=1 Tax=Candidatus Williamhamiltonella defendens TaxID=138072 RepID=UPI0011D17C0E|nr:hypothetical protein [Candidatus Hamiltonella defensa]
MKMYKNFNKTDIEALSEKQRELKYNINASYLQDENGDDWYDLQKTFQPDTFKRWVCHKVHRCRRYIAIST